VGNRLTRNEQVSGSSPLVGSLLYLQNPQKQKASDQNIGGFVSSTSAVDSYPKARSEPSVACLPMLGIRRGWGIGLGKSLGIGTISKKFTSVCSARS
jgi:hypothetical protein